jgi:hypothetical protein
MASHAEDRLRSHGRTSVPDTRAFHRALESIIHQSGLPPPVHFRALLLLAAVDRLTDELLTVNAATTRVPKILPKQVQRFCLVLGALIALAEEERVDLHQALEQALQDYRWREEQRKETEP